MKFCIEKLIFIVVHSNFMCDSEENKNPYIYLPYFITDRFEFSPFTKMKSEKRRMKKAKKENEKEWNRDTE